MRIWKDSFISYVTMVVQLLLSMGVTILITRTMGLEGRGEVSLLLAAPNFLMLIGTLGTAHACVYYLSKGERSRGRVVGATWTLTVLISVSVFVLCIPLWFVGRTTFLRGLDWRHLAFVTAFLPAELQLNFSTYAFRGMGRPDLFNLYRLLRSVVYFLCLAALWLLGLFTISYVLLAWAVSLVVPTFFCELRLWPYRKDNEGRHLFTWTPVRDLVVYGLKIYPTIVLAFLGYRLDIYIINSILSQADVGAYTVAVSVAEIVWYLPNAVGIVLFPLIARMTERQANDLTPLVIRQVLFLTLVAVLGLAVIGRPLLTLAFGAAAALSATPVLYLLMPGILVFSITKTIWQDLSGRGRPLAASLSMAAVVIIDVVVNLIVTPRIGVNGAAAASSISYLCGTIVILIVFRRVSGMGLRDLLVPTSKDRDLYVRLMARFGNRARRIATLAVGDR